MKAAKYYANNRELWDNWAEINYQTREYDVEGFLKGRRALYPIELKALGNVKGKSLLHLQCHFGLDTLSWARLGARATGVDFSDKAIGMARGLNDRLGLGAEFIQADIYQLPKKLHKKFDIVFTSYGVLCWLYDLDKWGKVISGFLKKGGTFFISEFHPFMILFDEEYQKISYPYFRGKKPIEEICRGSYADRKSKFVHKSYEWPYPLSDVVNALIKNGLRIERMEEYPFTVWNYYRGMKKGKDGYWRLNNQKNTIPLMFSIKAVKE
ncbi:MAG: hypothetical protein A2509_03910 [Candidatus Edwardsbacteria bacterium RIFOXYD12_FULL_50_11]|uniref:Methyltransferase type 11 domain-containing protein n=1 Tax=Candidatus Edwardsbacteria bacterium GWF2_54_11 TaxID=1817851 RepID=A0A1F5R7Q0_9BACT|nr:MAG: hypothetical protein A2502_05115 [Candidatus Edwardsbacteria bacterium RifOxyC12_full_54_24]OGF07836.1 MAG: hypothetical protein A2273_05070 [Candidatus Edwardsbacteria bacterium RifOxyA12_full_54_48]OGF10085.1 MAG: hypothetical protein A3K15_11485 [Candidatus Edwardsbacteria bacterium GWE2_54_12]OGF10449.1 MAG: hypothetical protein A2024_08830 [Candidatus Edwardsbacteria bacterium GWF2_54_11]OGF14997.1 MAG: hypothetical protein A2509_03910 [Candidatus Edwardsbacteria bacterium RIFOXYD1